MKVFGEEEVREVLTMGDSIQAIEKALIEYSQGVAKNGNRVRFRTDAGTTYRAMSASVLGVAGTKQGFYNTFSKIEENQVTFNGELISLYSTKTGELLAVFNSRLINDFRTGAAGAIGSKYLANKDSRTVGVFGSSFQARMQILGVCSAMQHLDRIKVYSRNQERCGNFCKEISEELKGSPVVEAVSSPAEAVRGSQIVIEATSSTAPVFDGTSLEEGTHVTSIGGSGGGTGSRQLDSETIKSADLFAMSSTEQGLAEKNSELLQCKSLSKSVAEIGDIVSGKTSGRKSNRDVTVFKCNGIGLYDIAVANLVWQAIAHH